MNRIIAALRMLLFGMLTRIIPRSDNIWVFGGSKGLRFADNSMYFFKYCVENTDKKIVWLTRSNEVLEQVRSEGFAAYRATSLTGMYYGLRARWHVFDIGIIDTSRLLGIGALQMNLWHGYPVKDFRSLKPDRSLNDPLGFWNSFIRMLFNLPKNNSHYHLVHQNKKHLWQMTDSFDVAPENVVIANYPRNIVFENGPLSQKHCSKTALPSIKKLEQIRAADAKVIGYFPTWRPYNDDSFLGTRDIEKIKEINSFLAKHNLFITTKWHSCTFKSYQHSGACAEAESLNEVMNTLSNVVVLGFEQDLNSFLNQCDLLISDYSGVIVDYLLSDCPQVFMAYDLERYQKEWGFSFDYEQFIPGPLVKTIDELKTVLSEYSSDPVMFQQRDAEKRSKLKSDLFENLAGSSSILEFMKDRQTRMHSK